MKLYELAIKRPIFITCIVLVMMVVGVFCFKALPLDQYPETSLPMVSISTTYSGAGPSEIETLITKPIEDEVSSISGLKRLSSSSKDGLSQVLAEFTYETDIKYAEQRVRSKVSAVKSKLPSDAEDSVIQQIDPASAAILSFSLEVDGLSEGQLYDLADQYIKPRIEQVNGVGMVEVTGGRKREIQVTLDRDKLRNREMSVSGVAGSISSVGENIPGGKVDVGATEMTFRSLGQFKSVREIGGTLLNLYGNQTATRVADVGTVTDTLEDETTRVFVNGKKSLFVDVYRQSGANTLSVANQVKDKMAAIGRDMKSFDGVSVKPVITTIVDGSRDVRNNVDDVYETIVIAVILTIVVVFLFLANGKSTFITVLALPNSMIGAFILMKLAGFTINMISLMALTLAVGLLIDDAIVVRENIFRHREMGEDPVTSAKKGTAEVQLAVIATSLVVISAFAPIAFVSGMMGQILKQFGLTVCFVMIISLFDALTMAPMLSAYYGACGGEAKGSKKQWFLPRAMTAVLGWFDHFQDWLSGKYEKVLRWTIRHSVITLAAGFLVFIVSIATVTKIPMVFQPKSNNGEFSVSLELAPGTNLDATTAAAKQVENIIRKNPEIEMLSTTVGSSSGESNKVSIHGRLYGMESGKRSENTSQIQERIRRQLKGLAAYNPTVSDYSSMGNGSKAFTMNLIGNDQQELEKYANEIVAWMKTNPHFLEPDSSLRTGKPEFQFSVRADKAQEYGIMTKKLGDEIRAQVEGVTPAVFRENGREYDVRVRLRPEQRNLKENYDKIFIPNVNGKLVKLSDFGTGSDSSGPVSITRQDRSRYVEINANMPAGVGMSTMINDMNGALKNTIKLPPTVTHVFTNQAEHSSEMVSTFVIALGMAVLFIYLILASLYESFITPFAIMLALPLALCGGFLALYLSGENMSIFAVLGVMMLLGISAKNSILLIDYAKQLTDGGLTRAEALVKAGRIRLRPILMTSIALIAGMVPVAMGLSEAAKSRTSMGILIIGGLVSSTLLSLIIVPAAYIYIDRFRIWSGELVAGLLKYKGQSLSPRRDEAGAGAAYGNGTEEAVTGTQD